MAYVYPTSGGSTYHDAARRFALSYREFQPSTRHALHVVFNGRPPTDAHLAVFSGVPLVPHQHDNSGWDVGAFQMLAEKVNCDLLVCLGAFSYFRRPGWLGRIKEVFGERGDALYGASASYERGPHIRTAGFWCHPELIRVYPRRVRTYADRYEFEHGGRSLTRLAEHLGLSCWMVTWDGVYAKAEWRTPPNIFRRGDQSNSLVHDRYFDLHESLNENERALAAARTDTVPAWIMRDGMSMWSLRSALLRLLHPFTNVQAEVDVQQRAGAKILADRVCRIRERVDRLER